jgi:dienelactone hydrolase
MSEAGFVVAIPDVFGPGGAWPMDDFPPTDGEKFMAWIHKQELSGVKEKVDSVRKHLQVTHGCAGFGIVGFCWGSMAALYVARTLHSTLVSLPIPLNCWLVIVPAVASIYQANE